MTENVILDETVELASELADLSEEVLITSEKLANRPWVMFGVGVVSLSIGALIGYKYAERKLSLKYEQIADEEIAEAKERFSALNKTGDYTTPEKAFEKLAGKDAPRSLTTEEMQRRESAFEALTTYNNDGPESLADFLDSYGEIQTSVQVKENPEGEAVTIKTRSNIFVDGEPLDEDDYDEVDVEGRRDDFPYILTEEEFMESDRDFEQQSLTYYTKDDVLVTESDDIVEDVDGLVGEVNLLKFGQGSRDQNLVYVRNVDKSLDFEIARHRGSYSEVVLGVLEHADYSTTSRRFRGDDD